MSSSNVFKEDVYLHTACPGCLLHSENHHLNQCHNHRSNSSPTPFVADPADCSGCRFNSPHQLAHIDPDSGCMREKPENDLDEKRKLLHVLENTEDTNVNTVYHVTLKWTIDDLLKKRRKRFSARQYMSRELELKLANHTYEVDDSK